MKKIYVLAWLLLPIPLLAWHYGPGQAQLARDRAAEKIQASREAAARCDWDRVAVLCAEAAEALPEEDTARRQLRLVEGQSRIRAGQMIAGQEQLEELLSEVEEDRDSDPALTAGVRHELATASYHAAWLMRLEGAAADEWKPESERARQQFRLLAEQAAEAGGEAGGERAEGFRRNLEATIRLEQMDLSVLRAKPLPKDCPSCKNLSQRKRKQSQARCKGKGKGKKKKKDAEQDVRKVIKKSRGAGLNEREGTGS